MTRRGPRGSHHLDHIVGVAMIRRDQKDSAELLDGGEKTAELGVAMLNSRDGRLQVACMPRHIGIGIVDATNVEALRLQGGDAGVRDLRCLRYAMGRKRGNEGLPMSARIHAPDPGF